MVSNTKAKADNNTPNNFGAHYNYKDAVNFIERGIEFFIFTNGDFDFNINQNDSHYDYNESRNKNNNGVRINRDYRGRITRIENTFINYDFKGNVSRIGSVFIRYYRDRLVKVGDLRIRYNRYGFPFFYGNVRDYLLSFTRLFLFQLAYVIFKFRILFLNISGFSLNIFGSNSYHFSTAL